MRGPRAKVYKLIDEADDLPYGPGRTAVLEEAVRLADAAGDVELGYSTRERLIDAAVMGGRGDLLLTHYAWCLARFDQNPDAYDEHELLWQYKWVMANAQQFPDIPLNRLEALLDDMERRFDEYGASPRTVARYRMGLAEHRGDKKAAAAHYAVSRRHHQDGLSDCLACEADDVVDHYVFLGRFDRAVEAAKDIVAGRVTCRSVPETTYAALLVPLLRLGDLDTAAAYHRAGMRLLAKSGDPLGSMACHLKFLGLTGNHAAGLRALERHLPAALAGFEPQTRFEFYLGAWVLLDVVTRAGTDPRVRVPPDHPLAGEKGVTASAIRDWLMGELTELAKRFDARNGTDSFAKEIRAAKRMHQHAAPYPLKK